MDEEIIERKESINYLLHRVWVNKEDILDLYPEVYTVDNKTIEQKEIYSEKTSSINRSS